ncbi:receptor-like protein EIX2 [Lactuca sativa]|uniref:receptor-like protein EIX2 n=1 Tax=Lactuca sativa TaxID=4236 RepID=UPI000CA6E827|nr:receptor-like protein EIX2 [Lactuca sativa]
MGNRRGLGLYLIFVGVFLVANSCSCLGVENTSIVCFEQERLALLKFKDSVEDGSGMLSSWVGNDCCMWERVHCDNVTGNIKSLHLRGSTGWLVGDEVSFSLAELRNLSYLDLSWNDFGGSQIPDFIGSFKHLSYLNLSDAGFQGIIPHNIGNLSSLKFLDISSNNELVADDMAWTSDLSLLEHFNLDYVDLSGAQNWEMVFYMIPSLRELSLKFCRLSNIDLSRSLNSSRILPNFKHLDLSFNDFKGPFPNFFQNTTSLVFLDLGSNSFNGSLPDFLQNTTSLVFLDLHFNSFNGPLPGFLQNMKSLVFLDLGFNYFKGPLPGFFLNMTSLTFLDLSDFDLGSTLNFANLLNMIPSLSELHLSRCGLHNMHLSPSHLNFSTLAKIQHLDLSYNSIGGTFPSFLTNMSSLRVLDLSGNMLNSSVPIIPGLLELDLSSNQFKQIEHVGIWRQCHLKKLSVSDNYFRIEMIDSTKNVSECSKYALERLILHGSLNGTVPKQLGRLKNLREIDLSFNRFTGSIPKSLRRLTFLEVLYMSRSHLTGPIPTFLGNLNTLDLSFNQLNGSIPKSFGQLSALTYVNLESNRLTGPIPTSLVGLVSLQSLDVSSNMLNGTIPVSIGQLVKLYALDISNNSLEGVVFEAHFANLSKLKELDTSSNTRLTFNVSREWLPPFVLKSLDLSSCIIANGFPQWLRNQRELKTLRLSNATISGPLPTWLQKMPIIPFLDLSYNKLHGPLTNLPNGGNFSLNRYDYDIRSLFLENNLFNASIPRSLCKRTDLKYLDLSRNRLTGKIPKCLGNLQELHTMILSSNRLSGVIPGSLALNSSLYRLKLNDNNFIGEPPLELGNLRNLEVLDLGDNQLRGNIPEWVGERLKNLMVLRLHKNNFTGRIPRSLCKSSNLQILDVAYNNLMGSIPDCLEELNAMKYDYSNPYYRRPEDNVIQVMKGVDLEYTKTWDLLFNMDLSSNKLSGEIPVKLTALVLLMGFNLSNNHLTGGIPYNIGNMKKLFSLDLSRNELTGTIPPSMAALNFLSHLNLSYNNLSGPIPTGNQLQTLDDPSIYTGNKDLCGAPLPKKCSDFEDPTTKRKKKHKTAQERVEVWLFYVDIMSGFVTGFWGVIGVLLFKKEWRWKLFRFAEETMDKIYVAVARVANIKRGREAT